MLLVTLTHGIVTYYPSYVSGRHVVAGRDRFVSNTRSRPLLNRDGRVLAQNIWGKAQS